MRPALESAIHVNQVGYLPAHSKTAMVGYYLGSLGELALEEAAPSAAVANLKSSLTLASSRPSPPGKSFTVPLLRARTTAFPLRVPACLEADFSNFKTPGEYRSWCPVLGFPFHFSSTMARRPFVRAYASAFIISVADGQ